MSEGDWELLWALCEHRVLTSGQLARKVRRSSAVVRRAMRKRLLPAELVEEIVGSMVDQKAYFLTRAGLIRVLESRGVDLGGYPCSPKPPAGPGSAFWRHTKLTNDCWIALERCCRGQSPAQLLETIPEWQMSADPKARRSKSVWDRFELAQRVPDHRDPTQFHSVRPDAMFRLGAVHVPGVSVAAYLEADRATESVRGPIRAKLAGFWHWYMRRGFEQHDAQAMRVLFVVGNIKTDRRLRALCQAVKLFCDAHHEQGTEWAAGIRKELRSLRPDLPAAQLEVQVPSIQGFFGCFRFCRAEDLVTSDAVLAPIWWTAEGEKVPLFRGPVEPVEQAS